MIGPTKLCPEGIGIVLFDLDNTVTANGADVSSFMLDTFSLARDRGCVVCVCTGRALDMLPETLRSPQWMDYLLCANGARVYDTFGKCLYERSMTRKQALSAIDSLEPLGPVWYAFVGDHSHFERRSVSYMRDGGHRQQSPSRTKMTPRAIAAHYARRSVRMARRILRIFRRALRTTRDKSSVRSIRPLIKKSREGTAKLGCSLPSADACERAMVALVRLECFEVARMGPTELEITAREVTKGTGALWLMDHLSISPTCAVAFGDSENDAPLAESCGTFVAVSNAEDRIREVADDVCESVYDDGVARWLQRAITLH